MNSKSAEMTSFYTAFRADDTLIDVLPSFDYTGTLPVTSTIPVGPFKAGIATAVPIWMAVLLQQRSLATISPPAWLNTSNLAKIIAHEKNEVSLWSDATRLPKDYYELSKRLSSFIDNSDAIALLIQDLFEIRLDKLRQQFQTLLNETIETDLTVAVNGIGTQELVLLQGVVKRALLDQHFLAQKEVKPHDINSSKAARSATAATGDTSSVNKVPIRRTRVPIRKFR